MRRGETICYYRPRGGRKNIYVTLLYDEEKLRSSIIQTSQKPLPLKQDKEIFFVAHI